MALNPETNLRSLIQEAVTHSETVKKEFDKIKANVKKIYKALGYTQSELSDVFSEHTGIGVTYVRNIIAAIDHHPDLLQKILDFAIANPTGDSIYS